MKTVKAARLQSYGGAKLAELVDQGGLKVHVDKTFPLSQVSAAVAEEQNNQLRPQC
jgi:NADPH:quinone reductase-like Zn-dependent oxidoreductase